MAALSDDGGGDKKFASVAAAAVVINAVTERHGFRVSVAGGAYVRCVRAGQARPKEEAVGKQSRDRKSQKCGCAFALHVCFGSHSL
jgi:hypothetical protein